MRNHWDDYGKSFTCALGFAEKGLCRQAGAADMTGTSEEKPKDDLKGWMDDAAV